MALVSMKKENWNEEEEALEFGFRRIGLQRINESHGEEVEETAATATVDGNEGDTSTNGIESISIITVMTNTIPEIISNKTEILTGLPIPQPPLKSLLPEPDLKVNPSHVNGTATSGSITAVQESRHHYTDMYLEPTFQKQPNQEFFCPNCNTCIRKVVLRDSEWQFVPVPPEPEPIRCTSCFRFLIPVGGWFNTLIRPKKEDGEEEAERDPPVRTPGRVSRIPVIPEVGSESGKGPVETQLPISTSTVASSSATTETESAAESGGGDKLEILKSVVYGGLAESITSLSVVTSAAAAGVSSLNLIAMALANLIGGLFVIIHNIWDLKAEQARAVLNENEEVDRYQKLLGKRKHFALHATLVLLSFLVFGIEPPLVYGFSFRESDNVDYKLAVVAGASFICISLLSLAKAHIQKPSSYHPYLKTLASYLVIGFAASGISYVASDLIKKLLDKLGLFTSESEAAFFLPYNDANAVNPTWSSY